MVLMKVDLPAPVVPRIAIMGQDAITASLIEPWAAMVNMKEARELKQGQVLRIQIVFVKQIR